MVGVLLRLWNLPAQILLGDELHAVRAALTYAPGDILFHYLPADNCIPLTLLDRWILDAGVPLSETLVRAPVVLCGIALLIAAPLWAWRRVGPAPAVVVAWLVALSPGLIVYTRIARSYAPATLLAYAAVAAGEAWHRRGGARRGAAFIAASVGAVWFHLGALPLALSPLLAAAACGLPRREPRRLLGLGMLGLAMAAGLALLLVPARATLVPLLAARHERLDVSGAEAVEVATWLAGTRGPLAGALFWVAAASGLVRLWRRDRVLVVFAATAVLGQTAGILWMAPTYHQDTVILARYIVPALPWAILPVAITLTTWWLPQGPPSRRAAAEVAALAVVAYAVAGPLLDAEWWRTSFGSTPTHVRFTAPSPAMPAGAPPACYARLDNAAPGPLLELPWEPFHAVDRVLALYQRRHHREVLVAVDAPLTDNRLALRNMVPRDPAAIVGSRARWLLVHRSVADEEIAVGPWGGSPAIEEMLRAHATSIVRRARGPFGAPAYRDDRCLLWDLDEARRNWARRAGATVRQPSPPIP